jgi:hypothetical protein
MNAHQNTDPITLATLADLLIWVAWRMEARTPGGKRTKVPYVGTQAKAKAGTGPWMTRSKAEYAARALLREGGEGGVGIEFTTLPCGRALGGIDLDSCRDSVTGAIEPWASEVIDAFASYTEVSPSQTGVKVFFVYDPANLPTLRKAMGKGSQHGRTFKRPGDAGDGHAPAIEMHVSHRYFTITEAKLDGSPDVFRMVPLADLLRLIQVTGPAFAGIPPDGNPPPHPGPDRPPNNDTDTDNDPGPRDDAGEPSGAARRRIAWSVAGGDFLRSLWDQDWSVQSDRSARAFSLGLRLKGAGLAYPDMVRALLDHPATAAWSAEKGIADQERELRRIWQNARASAPLHHCAIIGLSRLPADEYQAQREQAALDLGINPVMLDLRVESAAMRAAPEAETDAPEASANRPRPDLHVDDADLPAVASGLAKHLARRPMLFDRGGAVRLTLDTQSGGMKSSPLTVDGTTNEAHEICRPFRWVRTPKGPEPKYITLPVRVATLYLDRRDRLGLRPLDGIACAPLLHDDGSIRTAEGYDAESRLWCERVPFVTAPDAPTEADAKAALLHLRMTFRTFCFADAPRVTDPAYPVPVVDVTKPPGADESAFLVGLMTAVCRPSLPLAPGLVVRAPQFSGAGTGKGLLVRAICIIAFGAHPRAMTGGHDPAELDKRITAALIGADFAMFLDNLNSTALRSDALASAITERPAHVRPLGRSETVALNSAAFVVITGNALTISEDMARRFVTVDLDAGTENPESRPFTGDFLGDVGANRADLLRAALTIWRWGRLKGAALPVGKAMGSFPQWARWCRDPLLALGCADPADRIAATKAQDPRRAALGELFTTWWKHHNRAEVAVSELHTDVQTLADPANRGRQYLANKIRNLAGTRFGGFALAHHSTKGAWSPDKYFLIETKPAAPAGVPDDDEGAL